MFLNDFIDKEKYEIYSKKEIVLSDRDNKKYKLDYKTDYILQQLLKILLVQMHTYIQSTIDQNLQFLAEKSLLDNLLFLKKI
ncbi:MAG: hypothetical protein CM15mP70_08270 [Pelagibacteraceae bacterium]|nr:MAG: hypothetical protein CM15mP70_08270 [Pelagibacteraceae bacterium]